MNLFSALHPLLITFIPLANLVLNARLSVTLRLTPLNNNQEEDALLTQTIIQLIKTKKPQNVQQLLSLVNEKTSIPETKIIEHIIQLQSKGKISLKEPPTPIPQKLGAYLKTKEAYWYWITLILATTTTITVFTIPENAYPIVYIRYLLGTIFVVWLPGYSFVKALFPKEPPLKTSSKSLNSIERIALSIGVSLALAPIVGLLLNYTPLGIRLTPIVLSLLALTAVFATVGIIREHESQFRENP